LYLNRGTSPEGERKIKDFIFEWFFFFIFPIMLLLKGLKLLWGKFGPYFTAGLRWLGKELEHLWKTFYPWVKEKLTKESKDFPEDKDAIIYEPVENRASQTKCDGSGREELTVSDFTESDSGIDKIIGSEITVEDDYEGYYNVEHNDSLNNG
jgi:hypothetical protein